MLFEEFAQSGEDWGASNMVASMRASREHTRRGEYRYMSRAESLINLFVVFVYMPIITQYVLFQSRYWWVNTLVSTLCIHAFMQLAGTLKDLLKKYEDEALVNGIVQQKDAWLCIGLEPFLSLLKSFLSIAPCNTSPTHSAFRRQMDFG